MPDVPSRTSSHCGEQLLNDLDSRHEELLQRLESLNRRIEAVLVEATSRRPVDTGSPAGA